MNDCWPGWNRIGAWLLRRAFQSKRDVGTGLQDSPSLHGHRYKEALRSHPGCPAEVRLGLAACLFRLGDVVRAGAAYQRALALDPSCTQALLGLAVLKLSASQTSEVGGWGYEVLPFAGTHGPPRNVLDLQRVRAMHTRDPPPL